MFLFMEDEGWHRYMDELGIRKTIDYLIAMDKPAEWPLMLVDPSGAYVSYLPEGKPWYKCSCPCYEGYYLAGHIGSVKCRTAGELLPGVVWDNVCSKEYRKCPFYKGE